MITPPTSSETFGLPPEAAHLINKLRNMTPRTTQHHPQGRQEMSERDELADLLTDVVPQVQEYADAFGEISDAILAAGYRKPRTITTTDELDALPLLSIVMNNGSNPHAWQKRTDLYVGDAWYITSDADYGMDAYAIFEDGDTATVLYEPEETK